MSNHKNKMRCRNCGEKCRGTTIFTATYTQYGKETFCTIDCMDKFSDDYDYYDERLNK